jgi:hypothetical protein
MTRIFLVRTFIATHLRRGTLPLAEYPDHACTKPTEKSMLACALACYAEKAPRISNWTACSTCAWHPSSRVRAHDVGNKSRTIFADCQSPLSLGIQQKSLTLNQASTLLLICFYWAFHPPLSKNRSHDNLKPEILTAFGCQTCWTIFTSGTCITCCKECSVPSSLRCLLSSSVTLSGSLHTVLLKTRSPHCTVLLITFHSSIESKKQLKTNLETWFVRGFAPVSMLEPVASWSIPL